MSAAIGLLLF